MKNYYLFIQFLKKPFRLMELYSKLKNNEYLLAINHIKQ